MVSVKTTTTTTKTTTDVPLDGVIIGSREIQVISSGLVPLLPTCQDYLWGKIGPDSRVFQLMNPYCGLDSTRPWAELWVGTHEKAPAQLPQGDGEDGALTLDELVRRYPNDIVGDRVAAKFGPNVDLTFLFKVLSVDRPLSVQAHPNKDLASRLHQADPSNYPDSNHKPEIAVAVTKLDMLYGLQEPQVATHTLNKVFPELKSLVSETPLDTDQNVRDAFAKILTASDGERSVVVEKIVSRITEEAKTRKLTECEQNVLYLFDNYGSSDAGVAASMLMNLVSLQPGQAIYTEPFVPHAYLRGDLVEVMATSDNVVRLCMTPKFKDLTTFLEDMLPRVKPGSPEIIEPTRVSREDIYRTAADEFQISRVVDGGAFSTTDGPELLFCLSGVAEVNVQQGGQVLKAGQSVLIPAITSSFTVKLSEDTQLYRVVVPGT
jgi:mannose-6-phosphate isomerase